MVAAVGASVQAALVVPVAGFENKSQRKLTYSNVIA